MPIESYEAFDKADIRGKYLSLRKSTLTEIASAIEESAMSDLQGLLVCKLFGFTKNDVLVPVHFLFCASVIVLQVMFLVLKGVNNVRLHCLLSMVSLALPKRTYPNEVGFPVTNTSFDALLESLLSTAKPFPQSAGYRILAS
ncbi:hypothetical protein Tco_1113689 [Tanacetum coccineum]|uniref:Uncharacterized protein n=1 Tax=Tanacetum coccineum TaxID=301880 RepID=A0ABQ5IU19_9ASTR